MALPAVTPITAPRVKPLPQVSEFIRIPVPMAKKVEMQFASLDQRDHFGKAWQIAALNGDPAYPGFFQVNINRMSLPDGIYEYKFCLDGDTGCLVSDPYAEEIVKFGGYRATFRIENGRRVASESFDWDDELPQGVTLPNNNQMVIYEMPVRWMSVAGDNREVDLGTFDKAIFEHLDDLHTLGINAIELLPSQDSADTLNWGYGTRFFFSPDYDMGTPVDMKFFIKRCHQ